MISYVEFFKQWNGKHCEVAGSAAAVNQCVDLANAYIRDVWGLPIVTGTNAVDFPKKCLPPKYEYILNDNNNPDQIPMRGDVLIFKSPDGVGHISICDTAVVGENKVISFDQNWPVGSVCKLVTHTYTGTYTIVGWLRGKPVINSEENMTDQEKIMLEFIRSNKITEGQLRQGYGYITDNIDEKVRNLEGQVEVLSKKVDDLTTKLDLEHKSAVGWQKSLGTANDKIDVLTNKLLSANTMTAWQHIRFGINLLIQKSK